MDILATDANDTSDKEPLPDDRQAPEKYIRTFAGDIETVKSGGMPDLAPLGVAAVPKLVVTTANLIPKPTPKTVLTSLPVTAPTEPKNPPLQTYSADFSDRMKETNASTATVLAAEQDKEEWIPQAVQQEPARHRLSYIIAGTGFLIVIIAGGYFSYMRYVAAPTPAAPVPSVPAPIFVNEREEISGIGPLLLQSVEQSVSRPLAAGTIRLLYVTSASSTVNIFAELPVYASDILLRNMNAVGSMAGVVNVGGNQSPFFILPILSYSPVFFGMLQWEPLMPGHLVELFPPYPAAIPETAEIMTASTTSTNSVQASSQLATTTKKAASTKNATTSINSPQNTVPTVSPTITFVDAIIANHDVRVYRDTSGRDVLLYGFWNQSTLIIARDAAAFTEIIGRLATARAQ
ncbi:MAG: hypothetical protein Q8L52_02585 [bacterium]|nr:hypothetical protein [bacterium]